jgi:tetratricopeptide (TPR) repeat protein
MIDEKVDYPTENRYQLRRLIRSIEASYGELNLLICICDNPYYRDEIIHDYEAELSDKGINCDRVQIDRERPSLKQSLLDREARHQEDRPEIVTVLGIDGLLNVSTERDVDSATTVNRSAQAQFFFSTQWTREALREFRFPVILWMTESIAGELSRQAPDFWSWRGGVFEFMRPMAVANGEFDLRDLTIDLDDSDTSKSSANPEAIQAQIDKILATDPDSPLLRSLYLSLGIAYQDRSRKNITTKNADLEQAISTYHRVLELTPRDADPEDWATIQYRLGKAYSDRISGEQAANLEEAIRCYHLALEIRTRKVTYNHRIRGEKVANLEEAIRCCHLALQVFTHEAFPENWATTQNNLGATYSNRIRGNKAANLEEAIRCYHLALEVFTREADPENWAKTQNNLGATYQNRINGGKSANLEEAIRCCHLALEVFTREAFPENWATTQMNLGATYQNQILGDRKANVEQAIECYQLALTIFTHEAYPEQWIQIQINLVQAQQEVLKK